MAMHAHSHKNLWILNKQIILLGKYVNHSKSGKYLGILLLILLLVAKVIKGADKR